MKHEVFWKNPRYRERRPLIGDISCKYLIVGGGITGVSTAYFLAKLGVKDIVLVEKEHIASGATGKAAGILTPHAELDVKDMLRVLGKGKGLLWYHASLHALQTMKYIIRKERLRCDYEEEPTYYAALRGQNVQTIFDEYRVIKQDHVQAYLLTHPGGEIASPLLKRAIVIPYSASINPLVYTQELSLRLGREARVYEHTPVVEIRENIAKTPRGSVFFENLIDARDFSSSIKGVQPCLTSIIVTERLTSEQLKQIENHGKLIFWNAKINYDYFKITKDNRLLAGFGDVRSKSLSGRVYMPHVWHLKREIKRLFPLFNVKIAYAWSGILGVTKDYLPIVRFLGKKIVLAGTSSQVVSTLLAQYTANRLTGEKQALDAIFT